LHGRLYSNGRTHVDIQRLTLINEDSSRLVARDITRRLDNGPGGNCTDSDTREKGCEKEVIPGRNDNNVVFVGVKSLQKACCSPTTTENNNSFLRRIGGELLAWVSVLVGEIGYCTCGGDYAEKSDATESLEERPIFPDWLVLL